MQRKETKKRLFLKVNLKRICLVVHCSLFFLVSMSVFLFYMHIVPLKELENRRLLSSSSTSFACHLHNEVCLRVLSLDKETEEVEDYHNKRGQKKLCLRETPLN